MPGCWRERAAKAAAEGENAHNLSGRRTVNGKTLWKTGRHACAEGVSAPICWQAPQLCQTAARESLRPRTEGYVAPASGVSPRASLARQSGRETLKKTPFHSQHAEAGAKFGPFAGYDMPLFYPLGIMKEHQHTREKAGLFDISHMVHVEVRGPQAAALVSRACPYEAAEQAPGTGKYTFMLNENAGIIDDLIVSRLVEDRFLIVANAACAEKDVAHIRNLASGFDVAVDIIPRAFLALQGPAAESVMQSAGLDVADMAFMTVAEPNSGWFVSRSGYTGEDGFEIGLPPGEGPDFAAKLLADGNVEWIGLGARDSLRLEAGLPLYGQDMDETVLPHEAGLIWAVPKSLRESGDYVGAEALSAALKGEKKRKRIGLKPKEKVPVRGGAKLTDGDGRQIGTITSGGFGPTLGGPMALGRIVTNADENKIFADVRGRGIAMEPAKLPFVPHRYKR